MEKTIPQMVEWEIPPGWYHVRSAEVIPEDRVSPEEAGKKQKLRPFAEQMRTWCNGLHLRDEVWVEFTLGSVRAECMLLSETMEALHGGFLAVVTWNYFDRLWPFVEWVVYCARRGPNRVQLASDHFVGAGLVELQRAIRRLKVENMGVRDERDQELLLGMLKRMFKCDTKHLTQGYVKPKDGRLTEAIKAPITDYSAVERYARVTAIAVFAHDAADTANRVPGAGDEQGWAALAGELGYLDLQAALKKAKPFDWDELSALRNPELGELSEIRPPEEREATFDAYVEEWWTGK